MEDKGNEEWEEERKQFRLEANRDSHSNVFWYWVDLLPKN